jgi:transcriptional regulator with XRE-family HTH domain
MAEGEQRMAESRTEGAQLRELRLRVNIAQAELAKRMGVSRSTIEAIENGRLRLGQKRAAKANEVFAQLLESAAAEVPDQVEVELTKFMRAVIDLTAEPPGITLPPLHGEWTPVELRELAESILKIVDRAERLAVQRLDAERPPILTGLAHG